MQGRHIRRLECWAPGTLCSGFMQQHWPEDDMAEIASHQPLFGGDSDRIWGVGAVIVSALVALPVLAIGILALFPTENIWPHLMRTVLPGYIKQTLMLMTGVGMLTFMVGTATAWLVTMYRFPCRKWLQWALLIPLATPTYIIAYTYVDVFEYSGVVQSALRDLFGWSNARDYWFPEIRSTGGAIFVMSFVLYPIRLPDRTGEFSQTIRMPSGGQPDTRAHGGRHILIPSPCRWPARPS